MYGSVRIAQFQYKKNHIKLVDDFAGLIKKKIEKLKNFESIY